MSAAAATANDESQIESWYERMVTIVTVLQSHCDADAASIIVNYLEDLETRSYTHEPTEWFSQLPASSCVSAY